MMSNVLQQLFNAADMMVIGIFCDDTSLAAITSTGSICALLTGLLLGISIGANVEEIHTPNERLNLNSLSDAYAIMLEMLKKL